MSINFFHNNTQLVTSIPLQQSKKKTIVHLIEEYVYNHIWEWEENWKFKVIVTCEQNVLLCMFAGGHCLKMMIKTMVWSIEQLFFLRDYYYLLTL